MIHRVYIDECGYTGVDLLHKEQSIFALAAVPIEEDEAHDLKKHYFSELGEKEIKHARLNGDGKYVDAVAGCLEECLKRGSLGAVFYKPYVCAESFLMDMVTPFWPRLRFGSDGFRVVAFNLMNAASWFGSREDAAAVLSAYIKVCKALQKKANRCATEELYFPLYDAIRNVRPSFFKDLIEPLRMCSTAYASRLASESCLSGCCQGAAFALITQFERLGFQYELVVDTSPTLREIAPTFVDMKSFPDSEIRVSSDMKLKFPLRGFVDLKEIDSKQSAAVQLADLVAGTLVRGAYRRFGVVPKVLHEEYDAKMCDIWTKYPMNMMVKPALEHIDIGSDVVKLQDMICSAKVNKA